MPREDLIYDESCQGYWEVDQLSPEIEAALRERGEPGDGAAADHLRRRASYDSQS